MSVKLKYSLVCPVLVAALMFSIGVYIGVYKVQPFHILKDIKRSLIGYQHDINTTTYKRHIEMFDYFDKQRNFPVVMLGDSITSGGHWCALAGRADIANRGITGDTIEGVLARLEKIKQNTRQIFIMIGINDIKHGIPMDQMLQHYREILRKLVSRGYEVVVQSTLYTQIDEFNPSVKFLNTKLQRYCKELDIQYVDLNAELSLNGALRQVFTDDGIHLNFEGYRVWARTIQHLFHPSSEEEEGV